MAYIRHLDITQSKGFCLMKGARLLISSDTSMSPYIATQLLSAYSKAAASFTGHDTTFMMLHPQGRRHRSNNTGSKASLYGVARKKW